MNQIIVISTLKILHNATTLFFGIFVSAFFLGVRKTRKNIVTLLLFFSVLAALFLSSFLLIGEMPLHRFIHYWSIYLWSSFWYFIISIVLSRLVPLSFLHIFAARSVTGQESSSLILPEVLLVIILSGS